MTQILYLGKKCRYLSISIVFDFILLLPLHVSDSCISFMKKGTCLGSLSLSNIQEKAKAVCSFINLHPNIYTFIPITAARHTDFLIIFSQIFFLCSVPKAESFMLIYKSLVLQFSIRTSQPTAAGASSDPPFLQRRTRPNKRKD